MDDQGNILDAGWTIGLQATFEWVETAAADDTILFVDAPLIVRNAPGTQRPAEQQVGQRYGRWKVSANTTNIASKGQVGVLLREQLEARGWTYSDGRNGPPRQGRTLSECYPYTTLVGAEEFGYTEERPRYKRKPKQMSAAEFRPQRAEVCDELVARLGALRSADPPLDLASHEVTARLASEPSPLTDRDYKHREDLIDAALCAWTASLWHRFGLERCQVLGTEDVERPGATIIAPARPEQRRGSS